MGALVGFVLGALIGNLFGHRKVRNPESYGEVALQVPSAHYELGATSSVNGDSLDLVKSMALTARNTLNGLIDAINITGNPAYVANLNGQATNQTYGHILNGNTNQQKLYVKINGAETDFNGADASPDKAVDFGVLTAIRNTKIIGGDIFAKRAIVRSTATDLTSLAGDLKIADDYKFFTQNRDLIQQSITGAYATSGAGAIISQTDKDYYDNPAGSFYQKWLVDTVGTKGVAALSQTDLNNYNNANAHTSGQTGMIDRLVQSLQNQAIANPWIITLQRAKELQLDQFAPSDFYGGLKGFLDSALPFATDVHYEDMEVGWLGGPFSIGAQGGTNISRTTSDVNSVAAQIYRFYDLMFARAPSSSEYEGWVAEVENGVASDVVATWFMPYASWTNTSANSDFVTAVYQHAFGRSPTQDEINVWVANIANGETRGEVLAFFNDYADHRARTNAAITAGLNYAEPRGVGLFSSLTSAAPDGRTVSFNVDGSIGYTMYTGGSFTAGNDFFVPSNYLNPQTVSDQAGGDDIIIGGEAIDNLQGGPGWDWLNGKGGNDTISGQDGNDVILGEDGTDTLYGGAGDDYISGGAGNDQTAGGVTGGIWGGDGNDTLSGGAGNDALNGENGDDTFLVDEDGGSTWDWLDGGAGSNTGSFERFTTTGITLNLAASVGTSNGRTGFNLYGDFWISIENVTGTQFNDNFTGDAAANILRGLGGNDILNGADGDDVLEGGAGADQLIGGNGTDTASYDQSASGVYVDLSTGTAYGGDAEGDAFSSVENLKGSRFADELKGPAGTTTLDGGAGDDVLDWSGSSNHFVGGDGFDTVDFSAVSTPLAENGNQDGVYVDIDNVNGIGQGQRNSYLDTFSGVERFVGSPFRDEIYGSNNTDETFDGRAGGADFYGRGGSDTYVFGRGYGTVVAHDDNSSANAVSLTDGVKFSDLRFYTQGGSTGYLWIGIAGVSDLLEIPGDFGPYPLSSKNIVKLLDANAAGQLDIGALSLGIGGTESGETLRGSSSKFNLIAGYGGADVLYGSSNGAGTVYSNMGSVFIGGLGNDTIYASAGDDQFGFDRGDGRDTVYVDGGDDTVVFGSSVAATDVLTEIVQNATDSTSSDLIIGIKDTNYIANSTASQQADYVRVIDGGTIYQNANTGENTFDTIAHVQAGGTSIDLTKLGINWTTKVYNHQPGGGGGTGGGGHPAIPPLIFDLGNDGLDLNTVGSSEVVTQSASGAVARLSWVGPTDGILAIDRDGDGAINHTSEISFYQDKVGAKTDLEGLAAYDSNGDGVLDAKDAGWGRFLMWTDKNQNGRSTPSELQTLDAAGITSIDLHGRPTGFDGSDTTDSFVANTTTFTRTSGVNGTAYDVSLARRFLGASGYETPNGTTWWDAGSDATLGLMPGAASAPFGEGGVYASQAQTSQAVAADEEASATAIAVPRPVIDFTDNDVLNATSAARWADKIDPAARARREALDAQGMRPPDPVTPTLPPNPTEPITQPTTPTGPTTEPVAVGAPTAPSSGQSSGADAGTGAVSVARSGDGPVEATIVVPAATSSGAGQAWWSGLEGDAALGTSPLGSAIAQFGSDGVQAYAAPSKGIDAAALQRQQLLRQSMAAFNGAAVGASAPVWRRTDDAGMTVIASAAKVSQAPALSTATLNG